MAFSTKIKLANSKVEQLSGDTLQLSGSTILDGTSARISYINAPANFLGSELITRDFAETLVGTGSTASTIYNLASPVNTPVGGLESGTVLTGRTVQEILEEMLVQVFNPQFTAPSVNLTENVNNIQEVGDSINITYTATFDRGDIEINFPSGLTRQDDRSGAPNEYEFTGISADTIVSTSNSETLTLNNYVVQVGANNQSVEVSYDAGPQPLDSNGANFGSPLGAGSVTDAAPAITGIYPVFYGTGSTKPVAGSALLTNAQQKNVITSNGTITANYNTGGDAVYTWIAYPSTSTDKTVWFVTALSNGSIGTSSPSSSKYVRTDGVSVDSPDAFWTGVNYDFIISEAPAPETTVEFRNS